MLRSGEKPFPRPSLTIYRGRKQLPTISDHLTAPKKLGNVQPSHTAQSSLSEDTEMSQCHTGDIYSLQKPTLVWGQKYTNITIIFQAKLLSVWTSLALLPDFPHEDPSQHCLIITHCDWMGRSPQMLGVSIHALLPQVRLPLRAGAWYPTLSFMHVTSLIPHSFLYSHNASLGNKKRKKEDL